MKDRLVDLILKAPTLDFSYGRRYPGRSQRIAESLAEHLVSNGVVEVVRCKDCVWWEAHSFGSTIGRCENPRNGLCNEYSDDTDFCSYGERKE